MKFHFTKKCIIWVVICALVILAITLGLVFGLKSKETKATGAVVSNGRGCAEVGSAMIEVGGSAVDAAIATLLCEGALLPHSMGIGGGFIGIVYTKSTGTVETIMAREAAPAAAKEDMFSGQDVITGAIAGAIPGEILGYWELHKKYGRLPWKVLFQPTINLCKNGHWVSKYLADALEKYKSFVFNEPSMKEIFVKANGELYKEGDTLKRTKLGETLEKIAEDGPGTIYEGGEIGKLLVEDLKDLGGIMTLQDLMDYRVRWESSNHITANMTGGYTLYTTPLPSSGPLLVFILNVMSDLYTDNRDIYWHRTVETFKHAFGQRSNLGDMEMDNDMAEIINETLNKLQSQDFVNEIRGKIDDDKTHTNISYYGANFTVEDHGTSNMAVLHPNGDAVIITSTINTVLGGKVISNRTGILINDEMEDFSTPGVPNSEVPPTAANCIKPGKSPMSSMSPAIILDKNGNLRMLVGAAGGAKITTSVASVIIKHLIFNETMRKAIDDGRLHHQLVPMEIKVDVEVPDSTQSYLQNVGHKLILTEPGSSFAAVTGIGICDGKAEPYFDRRRIGSVSVIKEENKMKY